ncbi:hypothetical protein [Dorea formicigenerans]|uniref:hypothetical protein n=1 Tax=Dorea formicigenerans TaxID=39486 RepID=UPI00207933C8|nr:hypothetical protein [Dorea formicigenerans]
MNIHLITYLTSKLFWIYTVFRYNTILYPQNEDTQKLFAYFCAYLLSCWGSMQWGTMYGDLIFELIALLIITVAYQADWQHHVWNTLMVYIMGILCDGIPIVFFQRYAVARNPVHHHMGPGTIVMGNFIFFLLEVIIERKVDIKRSYYKEQSLAGYAFCPGDQYYSLHQDIAARQKRCAVYDCIILTVYQCIYFLSAR